MKVEAEAVKAHTHTHTPRTKAYESPAPVTSRWCLSARPRTHRLASQQHKNERRQKRHGYAPTVLESNAHPTPLLSPANHHRHLSHPPRWCPRHQPLILGPCSDPPRNALLPLVSCPPPLLHPARQTEQCRSLFTHQTKPLGALATCLPPELSHPIRSPPIPSTPTYTRPADTDPDPTDAHLGWNTYSTFSYLQLPALPSSALSLSSQANLIFTARRQFDILLKSFA